MSTMSLLNQDIVRRRQEMAPKLKAVLDSAVKLESALSEVLSSPLVRQPANAEKRMQELSALREYLENKYRLFSNGLVTVTIAGLEKSGKSTMLKELTGVELPTAAERCTAVSCEICYTDATEQEGIRLYYYTMQEVMEIVNNQLTYLKEEFNIWRDGAEWAIPQLPLDNVSFCNLRIPSVDDLLKEKYAPVLKQLEGIRTALTHYSSLLGSMRTEPLDKLPDYSQHKGASDHQPILRKIVIHKNFAGGSNALRFSDTPGVDDPNPHARYRTISAIKEETDFLVVMSKPDSKPSPTDSFHNFTAGLRDVDIDLSLADRTMFFVNVNPLIDPDYAIGRAHIEEVKKSRAFSKFFSKGPSDVMNPAVRKAFLDEINNYLINDLPGRDQATTNALMSRWQDIKADIRRDVFEPLRVKTPPSSEKMQGALNNSYEKWFEDMNGTGDQSLFFLGRLKIHFGALSQKEQIYARLELDNMKQRIDQLLSDAETYISEWLDVHASRERMESKLASSESPCEHLLPNLSEEMTQIVQKLVEEVTNITPLIQNAVLDVLRKALGDDVAPALCGNGSPQEQLLQLSSKMSDAAERLAGLEGQSEVQFIADNLREFAELSEQVGYILRHELRPALNLLSLQRWAGKRCDVLIDRTVSVLENLRVSSESRGTIQDVKNWLWRYKSGGGAVMPSWSGYTADDHLDFICNLNDAVFIMLHTLLENNQSQLVDLTEDYLEQAAQTLGVQGTCRPGWKFGLREYLHLIYPDKYREKARTDEICRAYRDLLNKFEESWTSN